MSCRLSAFATGSARLDRLLVVLEDGPTATKGRFEVREPDYPGEMGAIELREAGPESDDREPIIVVSEYKRAGWDFFVLCVIVLTAFEIPFGLLVGWDSLGELGSVAETTSNWLFFGVYFIDMLVNLLAVRHEDAPGVWGWRHLCDRVLPDSSKRQHWRRYLVSGWFLVDLVATIPFFAIAGQLGFLSVSRVARLFRFVRILHTVKLLKMPRTFKRAFRRNPALGRFMTFVFLVPWLWHIHACLLFWAERDSPNSPITTFGDALHHVFVAFTANEQMDTVTELGFWISVSAVLFSVIVVAAIFGNFSALFNHRDHLMKAYIEQREHWLRFFRLYADEMPLKLRQEIFDHLKDSAEGDPWLEDHRAMIESLPSRLETEVAAAIQEAAVKNPGNDRVQELSRILSGSRSREGAE